MDWGHSLKKGHSPDCKRPCSQKKIDFPAKDLCNLADKENMVRLTPAYDQLMTFYKDDAELCSAELSPQKPFSYPTRSTASYAAMVGVYNRLGGLFPVIEKQVGLDVPALLAVWLVESSGLSFVPKQAMIRFEVHSFFDIWGKRSRPTFDNHFRFGGHNQQEGKPWENQEYRAQDTGNFLAVHHNQTSEYATLTLARLVASDEEALQCISIGGCQIMLNAYRMLGYQTPRQMYSAFQTSERTICWAFSISAGINLRHGREIWWSTSDGRIGSPLPATITAKDR